MNRTAGFAAALTLLCSSSVLAQTTSTADPATGGAELSAPATAPSVVAAQPADTASDPTLAAPSADTNMSDNGMATEPRTTDMASDTATGAGMEATGAEPAMTTPGATSPAGMAATAPDAMTAPGTTTTSPTGLAAASTPGMATASFSEYDKDSDGSLTPFEFARMIVAGNSTMPAPVESDSKSMAEQKDTVKMLNTASEQFAKLDGNSDGRVSQEELASASASSEMMPAQ